MRVRNQHSKSEDKSRTTDKTNPMKHKEQRQTAHKTKKSTQRMAIKTRDRPGVPAEWASSASLETPAMTVMVMSDAEVEQSYLWKQGCIHLRHRCFVAVHQFVMAFEKLLERWLQRQNLAWAACKLESRPCPKRLCTNHTIVSNEQAVIWKLHMPALQERYHQGKENW